LDFRRDDLRCARFDDATITQGDFTAVDASGASFAGADLSEPLFERTSLFGASFAGAVINRGQFRNANLIGADITTTEFVDTRWGNTICPNGVNSDDAGGTCLGSRSAIDLPVVAFDEITDGDITVREGSGLTTYTIANDVLFDFDADTLPGAAQATLRQVVESIASRFSTDVEIQVWGHADAIGDSAYNLDLSQRRADNVAAVLEEAGPLDGYRIVAIGLGEAQPIAPNTNPDGSDNPDGRALNRRVEIVVRGR
jgi:outer membrane protein OmpA-like peptidoglycan-associated protein